MKMKDNYVIFICTFDPFLHGQAFYHFENVCLTCNPPLLLNDGTYKIFLNTAAEEAAKKAAKEDISIGITQSVQQAKLETAKTLLAFGDSIEKV